jgi:hypothetical protein
MAAYPGTEYQRQVRALINASKARFRAISTESPLLAMTLRNPAILMDWENSYSTRAILSRKKLPFNPALRVIFIITSIISYSLSIANIVHEISSNFILEQEQARNTATGDFTIANNSYCTQINPSSVNFNLSVRVALQCLFLPLAFIAIIALISFSVSAPATYRPEDRSPELERSLDAYNRYGRTIRGHITRLIIAAAAITAFIALSGDKNPQESIALGYDAGYFYQFGALCLAHSYPPQCFMPAYKGSTDLEKIIPRPEEIQWSLQASGWGALSQRTRLVVLTIFALTMIISSMTRGRLTPLEYYGTYSDLPYPRLRRALASSSTNNDPRTALMILRSAGTGAGTGAGVGARADIAPGPTRTETLLRENADFAQKVYIEVFAFHAWSRRRIAVLAWTIERGLGTGAVTIEVAPHADAPRANLGSLYSQPWTRWHRGAGDAQTTPLLVAHPHG